MGTHTDEIRFKVEQALRLMPRITVGALQSFLTSRVSNVAREAVLKEMQASGKIRISDLPIVSYRGVTSTIRIIESVKVDAKSSLETTG